MKTAIISNRVTTDYRANQKRILELAAGAIKKGAELILFPEAAATGLVHTGDVDKDRTIAEPIPGPRNNEWRMLASENGIYFAAGLLERDSTSMHDAAVLYNPEGKLILHYRRNDSGWHMHDDDPYVYREGTEIPTAKIAFGKVAFLICGDLWNDQVLGKLKRKSPDLLLYPFARDFDAIQDIELEWNTELISYKERWKESGARVLAANSFCENPRSTSIGGTWYVDTTGKILASSPILKESVLLVEL
jgi:predicted amidohydrolase